MYLEGLATEPSHSETSNRMGEIAEGGKETREQSTDATWSKQARVMCMRP